MACRLHGLRSTLLDGARVHVEHLPNMAVEVLKAVSVHEAVVLGFGINLAAGGDRLRDQVVHLASVFTGQRDQHLRALRGIREALGTNCLNLGWVRSMT